MKPAANRFVTLLAIGIVLALALTVRVECARDELWIDEYITGWTVAGSRSDLSVRARMSNQSLPYTWLMFGLTRILGHSPVGIRIPAFICGCAVVGLAAAMTWWLAKSLTALILAAFLAAIDQNFIFYSTEARPYALVQLFGLISCWSLVAWLTLSVQCRQSADCQSDPKSNVELRKFNQGSLPWLIVAWAVTAVFMFYSHYTSLFAIAAQFLIGSVVCLVGMLKWRTWLIAMSCVALACVPGSISLLRMYDRAEDWQAFSSSVSVLSSLGIGWWPYLFPGLLAAAAVCGAPKSFVQFGVPQILMVLAIVVMCLTGIVLVTMTGLAPLGHYRYAIAVAGLAPILPSGCLGAIRDRGLRVLLAGLIALLALGQTPLCERLAYGMVQPPMRFERWAQVVDQVNSDVKGRNALVIVFPNLIEDGRMDDRSLFPQASYFWAPLCVFNRLSDEHPVVARPSWSADRFDQPFIERLKADGVAWLVIRGGPSGSVTPPNELSRSIMEELQTKLRLVDANVHFEVRGPKSSDVQLIWTQITTGNTAR